MDLIHSWRQCILTTDKCIQTTEELVNSVPKIEIKDETNNEDIDAKISETIDCVLNIINKPIDGIESMDSMDAKDIDGGDGGGASDAGSVVSFNLDNNTDSNDSDFEVKTKFLSKSVRKRVKTNGERSGSRSAAKRRAKWPSDHDKRIESLVRPDHLQDDQYVCDETNCHFKTTDRLRFYNHLRRHPYLHKPNYKRSEMIDDLVMSMRDESANLYVCDRPDCTVQLSNKREFYNHVRRHVTAGHAVQLDDNDAAERLRAKNRRKQELIETSVAKYRVDDKYACDVVDCGFTATKKMLFYRHWRLHNPLPAPESAMYDQTLERPYVCDWPECGAAYKLHQHLKKHKLIQHMNILEFACNWPGCEYRTHSNHSLGVHQRTHTQEKPRACTWPGCEFRCSQKWSLTAHMRTHTGDKPYHCPYPECGFRCAQPCALTAHKRKHTGEKPYACDQRGCGKRFATLAGIHIHRKSHISVDTTSCGPKSKAKRAVKSRKSVDSERTVVAKRKPDESNGDLSS
ncbi:unnamed protein product [Medioppia subpectinata]|uniref:C2H2-type domain-containing protein n=1 Tax=Medioppia subpectinata TaxID=1979941 RepID=A0A7R9LHL8_9ACAR|nr:unnamed protein product [Medioppia subpectinata]CAG2118942.1 unnamed protein product [Medioppia subpectinata]